MFYKLKRMTTAAVPDPYRYLTFATFPTPPPVLITHQIKKNFSSFTWYILFGG
jgi:hypothetical protein